VQKAALQNNTRSQTAYARIAGAAYLVVIFVAVLNVSLVDARLIDLDDAATTARNIVAHESLFRIGTLLVLMMYATVIVLSAALHVVLKHVDEHLSRLALLMRCAEAILGAATAILSLLALSALTNETTADALQPHAARTLALLFLDVRAAALDLVLLFVGLGGAMFCHLLYRSKYIPRPLSVWGVLTYVSMLILACVSITLPRHPAALETTLYVNGTLFEVTFGAWLSFKGIDVPATTPKG